MNNPFSFPFANSASLREIFYSASLRPLGLIFLFFLIPLIISAQDFPSKPNPPFLVNDFTGTLSKTEIASLESKLVAFNDTTSTQIAIVLMKSIGGYEISDYTYQLGREWGIGQKGKNNGALILVAVEDRKMYIATGYGLEGVIPDALAKRIVEQDMKPAFKQGDYYAGLDRATDTMIKLASGEYTADDLKDNPKDIPFIPILFFLIFIIFLFFSRFRSAKSYASLNGVSFWTAWMLLNASRGASRGSWGGFSGGGGSSSGGGFGGFGGGSFGGGGAGGSW